MRSEKRILRDLLVSRLQKLFPEFPESRNEINRRIDYLIDMDIIVQDVFDSGYIHYAGRD